MTLIPFKLMILISIVNQPSSSGSDISISEDQTVFVARYIRLSELNIIEKYQNTLIELILNSNEIKIIDLLANFTKLTFLNLDTNLIGDISPLSNLIQLENIDSIEYLINLQTLDLQKNQIKSINKLFRLEKLTYLDLSYNQLIDITSLKYLINLKQLDLSSNYISNIDSFKSNLSNLNILIIASNRITVGLTLTLIWTHWLIYLY